MYFSMLGSRPGLPGHGSPAESPNGAKKEASPDLAAESQETPYLWAQIGAPQHKRAGPGRRRQQDLLPAGGAGKAPTYI